MRHDAGRAGTPRRAFAVAAALSLAFGCALPPGGRTSEVRRYAFPPPAGALDRVSGDSARIEIRDYRHSPNVEVFGWTAEESAYGLRALLRRDGTLVADHRLYVSTYAVIAGPVFVRALTQTRALQLSGVSRDVHACDGGATCTPYETFGARVPDRYLRSVRDSVTVRFHGRRGNDVIVTVRRDLIDAYLEALDSVATTLRSHRGS